MPEAHFGAFCSAECRDEVAAVEDEMQLVLGMDEPGDPSEAEALAAIDDDCAEQAIAMDARLHAGAQLAALHAEFAAIAARVAADAALATDATLRARADAIVARLLVLERAEVDPS